MCGGRRVFSKAFLCIFPLVCLWMGFERRMGVGMLAFALKVRPLSSKPQGSSLSPRPPSQWLRSF